MTYRGDSEPEYIDDDEFYDPDEFGESMSRRANVLGASGSRRPAEVSNAQSGEPRHQKSGTGEQPSKSRKRGRKESQARSKAAKARNPAPSMASSDERRARLAGRHQPAASSTDDKLESQADVKETKNGKSRLGGLRQRLSRGDRSRQDAAERAAPNRLTRAASIARGIGRAVLGLRGRLRWNHGAADGAGMPTETERQSAKASRNVKAGRFDAARESGRRTDDKRRGDSRNPRAERQSATGGARASRAPRIVSDGWLDLDRKLDLIGVGLVFGAIVFVFSALSPEQAAIRGLHAVLGQLLGWGAIAVPIAMFAVGLWLIVRHFGDEPPIIDPLRLSGISLAFLGALVLFQYLDSLAYPAQCDRECIGHLVRESYQGARGGGLIGGWAYSALVINLTELGGFVVVIMTLTIAAMFATRSSVVELAVVTVSLSRNLRTRLGQAAVQRRVARLEAQQQLARAHTSDQVHVRKPEPAQLSASPRNDPALPAPRSAWMPIPNRLKAFLRVRDKAEPQPIAEPAPIASVAKPRSASLTSRFWRRRRAGDSRNDAAIDADQSRASRLERFLNLGDDLPPDPSEPFAAASSPRPQRASTDNRAPGFARDHPRPVAAASGTPSAKPSATRPAPKPPAIPAGKAATAMPPQTFTQQTGDAPMADAPAPGREQAQTADGGLGANDLAAAAHESMAANTGGGENLTRPSAPAPGKPPKREAWDAPDYQELLSAGTAGQLDQEALGQQAQIIEETLASFGAPGRVVEVNSGPVITQYGVEPAYITAKTGKRNRVKVGAIAKLDKDLQLALGARSLRMEAPVPGKGYVGIEVPNPASARVGLRDVMDSRVYQRIDSPLAIALGMSVDGKPIAADLTEMPHLLIAGTTGSGKSVCVNAIINSILANNSPEAVRFIMVDPKRVELTGYNGLPHLVAPVVVELERILGVLRWVTTEMDERYKKFSRAGARNIIDFNNILDPDLAAMPYIVVIIDELADLMMMAPDDTERAIARIAALARATGIHLVIATQRPSVDVVTGLIKANCPARIAFAVASSVDSRVIIDQPGAERLLGKGDMLYLSGDTPAPQRVQGVHVSNEEIQRISRFWKLQKSGIAGVEQIPLPPKASKSAETTAGATAAGSPVKRGNSGQAALWNMTTDDGKAGAVKSGNPSADEDELYQTAVDMVRRLDKASISLLQRRLRIGYTRAARLVDMMEERGVVGPPKEGSSKPRDVLPA